MTRGRQWEAKLDDLALFSWSNDTKSKTQKMKNEKWKEKKNEKWKEKKKNQEKRKKTLDLHFAVEDEATGDHNRPPWLLARELLQIHQ